MLKCATKDCQNEGRYVLKNGCVMCGLCSIGLPAVRISDSQTLSMIYEEFRKDLAHRAQCFLDEIDYCVENDWEAWSRGE